MGHGRSAGGRADNDVVPRRGKAGAPGEGEAATPVASAGADAGAGETASEEGRRRRSPRSTALPPPPADRTIDCALSRDELRDIEPDEAVATEGDRADDGAEGSVRAMAPKEQRAWDCWSQRKRRARYGKLPKPPEPGDVELLYAKLNEDLWHLDDGERVLLVIHSDAWQSTVGARCRELDAAADTRQAYSAEECERVLLYQRLLGKRTYKAARAALASDEGACARVTLGFDRPRDHVLGRRVKYEHRRRLDGVPSEATISRYRTKRLPEGERAELYAECFIRLVQEHAVKFPEFREELRVIGFDGSTHKSIYKPGILKDEHEEPILDEDGNYIPTLKGWEGGSATDPRLPESKRGHGMLTVTGHTAQALPIACRTVRIHDPEIECVLDILKEDMPRIRKRMEPEAIGVCTMDGAFASPRIRHAHRKLGFIENTHLVSRAEKESADRHKQRRTRMVLSIEGYANWRANGLKEVFCVCGQGDVFSRAHLLSDGSVSVAVEGACQGCGPIRVTSGDWRRVKNPDRYVRVNPKDKASVKDADLAFGNPLTYNDVRAEAYGRNRYAQGEGLHGSTTTRWNLFKDKAYYRRLDQARLDVLLTYCLMHGLAMEARRERAQAPPACLPKKPRPAPAPGRRPVPQGQAA